MSEVVGSTPNFTRSGRPSASFWRNSSPLMICAAPVLNSARASSGCMIKHRIAHPVCALLVFVQQLAHLVDRERRVLPVERLLAFTLIEKWSVLGVRAAGDFLVGLSRVQRTPCRLCWISALRISD